MCPPIHRREIPRRARSAAQSNQAFGPACEHHESGAAFSGRTATYRPVSPAGFGSGATQARCPIAGYQRPYTVATLAILGSESSQSNCRARIACESGPPQNTHSCYGYRWGNKPAIAAGSTPHVLIAPLYAKAQDRQAEAGSGSAACGHCGPRPCVRAWLCLCRAGLPQVPAFGRDPLLPGFRVLPGRHTRRPERRRAHCMAMEEYRSQSDTNLVPGEPPAPDVHRFCARIKRSYGDVASLAGVSGVVRRCICRV